jgi:putative ABC transport system substrate-binding protein
MKRREFITLLSGMVAWPLAARAQPSGQTRRLVVLMGIARDASAQADYAQFLQELEKLGWTSDRNIRVDERWGEGDMDRILVQAKELVGLKPDAIFVFGIRALTAMHRQTVTIPIVAYAIPNDYVENRARPAGNVTGFTVSEYSLSGKWVETLKDVAPQLARVALLHQSNNDATLGYFPSFEAAAQTLGVRSSVMLVHDVAEVERGIKTFARVPNGGLVLPPDVFFITHRDLIIGLAATHRLPTIYSARYYVTSGGLISYGSDRHVLYRQAAGYIDRLLKGEKLVNLPVQAPTKWELVLNLKTAKALGLDVPPTLLSIADEVIE